jgi:hypothetical protein
MNHLVAARNEVHQQETERVGKLNSTTIYRNRWKVSAVERAQHDHLEPVNRFLVKQKTEKLGHNVKIFSKR